MIYKNCGYYTGDEDCNSCVKKGYLFSCDGCKDYDDGSPACRQEKEERK